MNDVQVSQPLSKAIFDERARVMMADFERLRAEHGMGTAITMLIEGYVEPEERPELKQFCELLALARRQAMIQQRLDEDRERLHHGDLDHEQRVSVGHHYEMLRHDACVYNHMLRSVIELSGQYFTRDELANWLTEASLGRYDWVRAEMSGAMSEVALYAALQGLPELRQLRYATVEEDLAGYDFVAQWQGKLLTIDAKTGRYYPLVERKHGHKHLEVSVPREILEGFRITRHGLEVLRAEARRALASGMVPDGAERRRYQTA